MRNGKRGRYTFEFKQEAVRLVESGQKLAAAARSLGVVEQTLGSWMKLHRAGRLKGVMGQSGVTAEQMEISRLRAELARVTMERDILGKATAFLPLARHVAALLPFTRQPTGRSAVALDGRWSR